MVGTAPSARRPGDDVGDGLLGPGGVETALHRQEVDRGMSRALRRSVGSFGQLVDPAT